MNETVFKEILGEALNLEISQFDNAPEHKFSLKHRIAMKFIFAKYNRNVRKLTLQNTTYKSLTASNYLPHCRLRKRLALLWLVILLMALLLVGCSIASFVLNNFKCTVYQDNTQIEIVNIEGAPNTINSTYTLARVPDGYEMTETYTSRTNAYTLYINPFTEQEIILGQWVKRSFKPHYNTEYNSIEEVDINGGTGLCIDFSDVTHNHSLVVWDNGDYIIEIVADLDKKGTLQLSEINKV